jgi:imidazolonepropionase-like amidohydrolase
MSVSVIKADLLIPGRGEPLKDAAIAYQDSRIIWVGKHCNLPEEYLCIAAIHVPTLMPGLWDCHVHFLGSRSFITEILYKENRVLGSCLL